MIYPKIFSRLLAMALVLLLLMACGGKSASPKPGATFVGKIAMDTAKSAQINFKISADGQSIESLGFSSTEIKCGGFSAGSTSSNASGQYPVMDGKIEIKSSSIGDITGRFTSPTKAEGSIHVLLDAGMGGSIDCGTWDWSTTSE
jgi:hypothetical protein